MINKLDVPWHGLLFTPTERMSEIEARTFLSATMTDMEPDHGDKTVSEMFADDFGYQILHRRLLVFNPKIRARVHNIVIAFLASISDSPGDAVMWAYTLNYMLNAGIETVGMSELADVFRMGFPSKETRHIAWDAQKGFSMREAGLITAEQADGVDNWVDNFENWPGYTAPEPKVESVPEQTEAEAEQG